MSPHEPGEGEERELEGLLARLPAEPADPARRATARAAFLAAVEAARSRTDEPLRTGAGMDTAAEEAFEAWLARVAPPEPAEAGRRARARAAFLSTLSGEVHRPRVASRRLRLFALALAAAGILFVTFLLPERVLWRVELLGPAAFDEQEFQLVDEGRLASELERPGRLVARGTPVRLTLGDALELELRGGSRLLLPGLPELDGGTPLVFELERGEVFLRTLARWSGNPLFVRTPFGDVRAVGTTFGVLVQDDCMCVCVAEGAVEVGATPERVEAGHSALFTGQAEPAPQRMPFPTAPDDPAQAHTGPLVLFRDEP